MSGLDQKSNLFISKQFQILYVCTGDIRHIKRYVSESILCCLPGRKGLTLNTYLSREISLSYQ